MAKCTHCGAPIKDNVQFCAYCGTKLNVIDEDLGRRILSDVGTIKQAVAGGAVADYSSEPVVAIVRATGAAVTSSVRGLRITGVGDVSFEHIRLIDESGGLTWVSKDARDWFYASTGRMAAAPAPSTPNPASADPQEKAGWFTRQSTFGKVLLVIFFYWVLIPYGLWVVCKQGFSNTPLWGQILFVLFYPVSLPYGVWFMWKQERFNLPIRIGLSVAAVVLFAFLYSAGTANQ